MFAVPCGMQIGFSGVGVFVLALATTQPLAASHAAPAAGPEANPTAQGRAASGIKLTAARFDNHQVPAGAALLLKLRTPLDSASASVDDQVEATFWSPVIQDDVELIPVGSVAIGRVVEVTRASERTPTGAVTFAFSIVEHAVTGSRAMVNTRTVVVEGVHPQEAARGRAKRRPRPVDASMAQGTSFVAVTAAPLLVRIPR